MPAAEHNMADALARAIELTKTHPASDNRSYVRFNVLTDDLHYVSVTVKRLKGLKP